VPKNSKTKPPSKPVGRKAALSFDITIFSPAHNNVAALDLNRNLIVSGWVGLVKSGPSITAWFVYNGRTYISMQAPTLATEAPSPTPTGR
jgi:hypothetical protein